MATIEMQQAVDQITSAITNAGSDDVVEIYNELFPKTPTNDEEAGKDASALMQKILRHIAAGLEVEEVLDLWKVIFPNRHKVWFDEDAGLLHYDQKIEHAGQAN